MSPIAIEADSPPQSRTFMRRFAGAPLPWIMPVIVVIGIFYLYPVIDVFRLSFTNATLIGDNQDYTLGSITNALSSPQLPDILWATLIFVGGSVIGQQILGLAVAVVVIRGEKRGLFGTTILRTTALVARRSGNCRRHHLADALFRSALWCAEQHSEADAHACCRLALGSCYCAVVHPHFQHMARHRIFDGRHVCGAEVDRSLAL